MSDIPSVSTALNTILSLPFPTPPYTSTPSSNLSSPCTSPYSQSSDIFKFTSPNCAVSSTFNILRTVNNILLILFRNHPHGIFESELPLKYHQTFADLIVINHDLKYLLLTHHAINITSTQQRGLLYTLNPYQMSQTLKSFDPFILKPYVAEHVLRLFNYFPNGIASSCFEETLLKLSQFTLSTLIPWWIPFVTSIPGIICNNINGVHIFINMFKPFDARNVLLKPVGYDALIKCVQQQSNIHLKGCDLESVFTMKFNTKLCIEAPYIASILSEIESAANDKSPYSEDHCSVFVGGFAHGTTTEDIRRELNALGFIVINCSEIKYRKYGFSWVTLSSTTEADYLIKMSPIQMMGRNIDVRPYINREKQQKDKPGDTLILQSVIELLLKSKSNALSIREIQPILFRLLSYRVSGNDLVEIIKKNCDILCITADESGQEKIFIPNNIVN